LHVLSSFQRTGTVRRNASATTDCLDEPPSGLFPSGEPSNITSRLIRCQPLRTFSVRIFLRDHAPPLPAVCALIFDGVANPRFSKRKKNLLLCSTGSKSFRPAWPGHARQRSLYAAGHAVSTPVTGSKNQRPKTNILRTNLPAQAPQPLTLYGRPSPRRACPPEARNRPPAAHCQASPSRR
jgi:hypothetical protein